LLCRAREAGYFVADVGLMAMRFEGRAPDIVFAGTRAECLSFIDARFSRHENALLSPQQ